MAGINQRKAPPPLLKNSIKKSLLNMFFTDILNKAMIKIKAINFG